MSKELRIIVAGGRDFNDYDLLHSSLAELLFEADGEFQVEFISGTCRGADILGEQFAYNYGYNIKRFPANWDKFGKRAGWIRNCNMAKYASEAERGILVAFWDGKSKGTRNMISIAKEHGLNIHVIKY